MPLDKNRASRTSELRMVPYSLYLPQDWWERIDQKRNASRPEYLRNIIREAVDTKSRPLSEPPPVGRPKIKED